MNYFCASANIGSNPENRREIHILKIVKNIFQVLLVCAGSHPTSDFSCHLLYLENGGVLRILRVLR